MRFSILLATLAALAVAADKGPPKGSASNRAVKIEATAWLDKESIDRAVGAKMEEDVVVLDVKITPLDGEPLKVWRDDFLLRSDKDGQKANPYAPTQIAGSSVLVISDRHTGGGGIGVEDRGPAWGGIGGPPRRLPGSSPGIGNTAGTTEAAASVREGEDLSGASNESPLLRALKEKVLPEKEITEPLSGQLHFLLEGKHKVKQIELIYKTAAGPLSIRFKE